MDDNMDDNLGYYSIAQLLSLNLPGYPTTRQGWDTLVKRDGWEFRKTKGLGGPGGVRREYRPPANVLELIRRRQLAEAFNHYRVTVAAGEPLATARNMFVDDYNTGAAPVSHISGIDRIDINQLRAATTQAEPEAKGAPVVRTPVSAYGVGVKAELIFPGAEWLARMAMYASEAEWLQHLETDRKVGLIMEAFRMSLMLAGGDEEQLSRIMNKKDAMLSALRLAYEIDCSRRKETPGENP